MISGERQAAALGRYATTAGTGTGHHRFAQHWPMVSRLRLGPLPSAVPCARLHAKLLLKAWNLRNVADDAEMIVSELTTNALKASWSLTDPQPIVLQLLANHERLTIQVWDALPVAPDPQSHAIDAETGRGLEIVSLLSDRWGFHHPNSGGKIVWATVELTTPREPGR
jgi:anti-sigma regulatory factor (Ser/Thr protein kinase)